MNNSPSQSLLGVTLPNGWFVKEIINPGDAATGGNFCSQYYVEKGGSRAFMKAIDLTRAMQSQSWTDALQECLQEYHFERDLYIKCKDRHMSHVVVPVDHGMADSGQPGHFSQVPYIIFELATNGDFRKAISDKVLTGQSMANALYGISLGIFQLHQAQIAHQDLKPSNVLIFDNALGKISDLGRASDQGSPFKWDSLAFAGDRKYAPIEIYFGSTIKNFSDRYAIDLYMLGSLIFFAFLGVPINALLKAKCVNRGYGLSGLDFQDALPFLEQAFSDSISDIEVAVESLLPGLGTGYANVCKELCCPNPLKRGKKGVGISPPSAVCAQRYVGLLKTLSLKSGLLR